MTRNRSKRRRASHRKLLERMVRARMAGSPYYRKRVEAVGFKAFVESLLVKDGVA